MYTGAAKIVFKTIDISELVPAVATSIGAIVIAAEKGNVDNPVLVTNKAQFIQEFGKTKVPANYADAGELNKLGKHAAMGFLQTGRRLYVQRVVASDAKYGGAFVVKNGSSNPNAAIAAGVAIPSAYVFGTDQLFAIFGKDPGVWNDDLAVTVTTTDVTNKIFKIEVYSKDEDGVYQLVESFDVSRKRQTDGYGTQLYLENVINGASGYIKVKDNTAELDTVMPKDSTLVPPDVSALYFDKGADGTAAAAAEFIAGWGKFSNKAEYAVNILINGGKTDVTVQQEMRDIAEDRVDCTCILDMPYASINSVANMVTFRTVTQNFNTSFAAIYGPWIKIFDDYNGQIVSIPPSGDIAAVYATTDYIYGAAHGAPAGYNRGILGRALQLSFGSDLTKKALTPDEMDTLDDNNINSLLNDPGWGILVFGEETQQSKRSALSNVHVRRLLNQIAVSTTRAAKSYLYEPLLDRTYFRVRMAMEQYMAELEGLGAFDNVNDRGWKVVCDATNNTASDRDQNQMNVWLFIKPVKVAKYIEIKAIITRSTASFEAVIAAGIV